MSRSSWLILQSEGPLREREILHDRKYAMGLDLYFTNFLSPKKSVNKGKEKIPLSYYFNSFYF